MRYSGDPHDPGHKNCQALWASGKTLIVRLNGEEVDLVQTVDTDLGYIKHLKLGELVEEYGLVEVSTRHLAPERPFLPR